MERKPFRLRTDQVTAERQAKLRQRTAYGEVYAEATAAWADLVRTGQNGKGDSSAAAVAARFAAKLPEEIRHKLTGR